MSLPDFIESLKSARNSSCFLPCFGYYGRVKSKSTTRKSEPKRQGNYVDTFVKKMFGQVLVFADFLLNYADKEFVAEIDKTKITRAPTHYIDKDGSEQIADLVFQCPLKNGNGSLMAIIIFEHQSGSLKRIPHKLLKYIAAIWDAEMKDGKPLSAPYFIVLRTGKKQHRGKLPKVSDLLPKDSDGKPLGKMVEIEYDVVDLPAWDFDHLVGGTVLRLALGMLHKMTGGNLDEFPEALKPLWDIANEGQRIELTKELLDFVDKAFKAHHRRLDAARVKEAIKTVFPGKEETMIKSVFDEKVDEGIIIGESVGRAKMVLKALRKKFKKVPKHIEQAVLAKSDPIVLESLLEHVFDSNTLDEFAEML